MIYKTFNMAYKKPHEKCAKLQICFKYCQNFFHWFHKY